jgi:hypothetical protein
MDLEDDAHMAANEVINVPIMISPEIYKHIADLVIQEISKSSKFKELVQYQIEDWMDHYFDINDHIKNLDTEQLTGSVCDEVIEVIKMRL